MLQRCHLGQQQSGGGAERGGALLLFLCGLSPAVVCFSKKPAMASFPKKVTNEQCSAWGSYQLRSSATLAITRSLLSTAPPLTCHEHAHENQHPRCTPHSTPQRPRPRAAIDFIGRSSCSGISVPAIRQRHALSSPSHPSLTASRTETNTKAPTFHSCRLQGRLHRLGGPAPAAVEIPMALADPKATPRLLLAC